MATWDSNDSVGAYGSALKLTLSGVRHGSNGGLYNEGENGYYWSATADDINASVLFFTNADSTTATNNKKARGHSVRCIKN
jgi:uncharacterized protein (TIGR02145 family)